MVFQQGQYAHWLNVVSFEMVSYIHISHPFFQLTICWYPNVANVDDGSPSYIQEHLHEHKSFKMMQLYLHAGYVTIIYVT